MKSLLFILCSFFNNLAWGLTCTADVPARSDVFQLQGGNITVGNEVPVGSIIYQQTIKSYKDYSKAPHMNCSNFTDPPYTERQYVYLTNTPKPLTSWQGGVFAGRIYSTDIPGIGAVIAQPRLNAAFNTSQTMTYTRTADTFSHVQFWIEPKLLLIKTGAISPGVILGNNLPSVEYRDTYFDNKGKLVTDFKPYKYSFSGSINVISKTCKVNDYNVDLGSWNIRDFLNSNSTKWVSADIILEDCPKPYGTISSVVTDHLTGVSTDLNRRNNSLGVVLHPITEILDAPNGIIAIESSNNSASGVGIQIAEGNLAQNNPAKFDVESKIEQNTDGATTIVLPMLARYIKTSETIRPGKAKGRVVYTINYY